MHNSLSGLVEIHTEIPCTNVVSILNDVCCGLQYMHSRNPPIVHRDLTPNNILLCFHLRAKITDLGVAKAMQTTDTKTLTQAPGTRDFMPPESLTNKPVYGLPLDIFSFGGVILYVTTQQWPQPAPWIDFDPDTGGRIVLTELQRRQQYLDKMTGIYTDLKPLVVSCLDDNPVKRPSVAQVLLEIKKTKNAFHQNFFSTIWSAEVSDKQSTTQSQNQQNQLPNMQEQKQRQQEQSKLQKGKEAIQQQIREKGYEQLGQKVHSKLDTEQLPQVSYANYICACSYI